jgi:hypothetical protein
MLFEYKDNRNWNYIFVVNEDDLTFIDVESRDDTGNLVHKESIAFFEDVFNWRPYHTRGKAPLISSEAREFCEKSVGSYLRMKAFW